MQGGDACMLTPCSRASVRCPIVLMPKEWEPLTSPSPPPAAASGPEDVALYVGLVAVAVCLLLLLLVLILVYCRKKEGLDSDVADSSILTSGFQPVSIKPSKAGVVPLPLAPALGPMPGATGPGHPQCHSLSLPLSCRQSPSAHHPARPQHHHHHLPGQPVSPAGWAQPQVPANQWAPAQPAEWRPPHAAPQLAHLGGRGLCLPPVHPELLPLPAARHQQHGLWDFQLPRGPADDPSYRWEGPQSARGALRGKTSIRIPPMPLSLTPNAEPGQQGKEVESGRQPRCGRLWG